LRRRQIECVSAVVDEQLRQGLTLCAPTRRWECGSAFR
jgi:hypothetical protein